jgi:hypothetical protein
MKIKQRTLKRLFNGMLALGSWMFLMSGSAQAQVFTLAPVNNNNCAPVRNEILLLNTAGAPVQAICSDRIPGGFPANNGKLYDFRLMVSVHVPTGLAPGASIQLGDVFTNDCNRARALFSMLSTSEVLIQPTCSSYIPGGYVSSTGRAYDYKLSTFLTRRY